VTPRRVVTVTEARNDPVMWSRRIPMGFVVLLLLLIGLARHAWLPGDGRDHSPATVTAATSPTSPQELVEQAARDLDPQSVEHKATDFVVNFRIANASTEGSTRARLARSVYVFLERLRDSGVEFGRVVASGSLTDVNKYGEVTSTPPVFRAAFNYKTVHRIQYDNIERDDLSRMRHLTAQPIVVKHPLRDDAWTW
jgi:hypothetical protein